MELLEANGFKKENIFLVTDENAKIAQIRNALRNFPLRARPDDLLVLYFAGYGLHDPTSPDRLFLAAHDTQLGQMEETALPLEDLKSLLGPTVQSRRQVFLFDAARPLTGDWNVKGNNLINDYLLRLFSNDPNRSVLVSGSVNEVTNDAEQGLFTGSLVAAAKGDADWNFDQLVTLREWFEQVASQVKAQSGGKRNPRFSMNQGDAALFTVKPR
jgi:uncharacterized caspase-like protein